MYLKIENSGECPIEGFTILGVSSARGNNEKIGQFGSGAKHGILTCMRFGLNPIIYIGNKRLEFYAKPKRMGNTLYNHIYYNYNGVEKETGFSLEFGSMDWNAIKMALREFISNAIDQSSQNDDFLSLIDITENHGGKPGYTRVYIQMTPDLQKYVNEVSDHFLHFTGQQDTKFLEAQPGNNGPKVYRKGVFVKQDESKIASLFDYNFGEELQIDEARNLDSYRLNSEISKILSSDVQILKTIFRKIRDNDLNYYEIKRVNEFYFRVYCKSREERTKNVQTALFDTFGTLTVAPAMTILLNKKLPCKMALLPQSWYEICIHSGCADGMTMLGTNFKHDVPEVEVSPALRKNVVKVWTKLANLSLTKGKMLPVVKCFEKPMSSGEVLMGFYNAEKREVWINKSHENCLQTILEELSHYITEAADESRDFQDFAFLIAARLIENA